MSSINQDDVLEILRMVEESNFDELHLETGDLKLIVKKGDGKTGAVRELETRREEPTESIVRGKPPEAARQEKAESAGAVPSESPAQREEPIVTLEEEGLISIKAPMLGTFYRAPKPGARAFVEVGQVVSEDDTVCIIEVMKLFNTVKAGVRGRIAKICVENAQMVEFQQTLFLVEQISEKEASKKVQAK